MSEFVDLLNIKDQIIEANKKLRAERRKFPHQEAEPAIVVNGYIYFNKPVRIIETKSYFWISDGNCAIYPEDIISVEYVQGHGV